MAAVETWAIISSLCKDKELLKHLQCPSCQNLLQNPVQPSCGHRLCQMCADHIIQTTSPPCCPLMDCGEEFTSEDGAQYFPDRFVRREIQGLEVRCHYFNEGCNWEGTYAELKSHIATCSFSLKEKRCPLEPLGCPYKTSVDDNGLNEHMQESHCEHLTILVKRMQLLTEKLKQTYVPLGTFVGTDGKDQEYETLDVPGYYDLLDKGGGASSVTVKDTRGDPHSLSGKRPFAATPEDPNSLSILHFRELIAKELEGMKDKVFTSAMDSLQSREGEIASLRTKVSKLEKQIRAKNAEIEDRDFRLSLIESSNHDGSLIWNIPQFSQRKADAVNGKYTSMFSLPFYSGRCGYKMCLRLYIMGDGIGKGTHLSLFFVVMRGQFDSLLQWPFTHKITFKLINQAGGRDIVDTFQPDPMSSSFRKPKSDMNIASGCPRFVSHAELERGGFIVDDTIFVKCTVVQLL